MTSSGDVVKGLVGGSRAAAAVCEPIRCQVNALKVMDACCACCSLAVVT